MKNGDFKEHRSEVMRKYGDIIDLSRPVSTKHPPMSMAERAAQFSPFAALTGYEEVIGETARTREDRVESGMRRVKEEEA